MIDDAILPCTCKQGGQVEVRSEIDPDEGYRAVWLQCSACGSTSGRHLGTWAEEGAIKQWNFDMEYLTRWAVFEL